MKGDEFDQLKTRVDESGPEGIKTAEIRDDYEPTGDLMMLRLCDSGEYVQRKVAGNWRIYRRGNEPIELVEYL